MEASPSFSLILLGAAISAGAIFLWRTRRGADTEEFARDNPHFLLESLMHMLRNTVESKALANGIVYVASSRLKAARAALLVVEDHHAVEIETTGFPEKTLRARFPELEAVARDSKDLTARTGRSLGVIHDLGIEIIVPLSIEEALVGILILGPKTSGEPYRETELGALRLATPSLAVAIENGKAAKYVQTVRRILELDEAKSEFISVVSHQLRTPLSIVRWNIELLLENAYGEIANAKMREIIEGVYRGIANLTEGLNNLLTALEISEGMMIVRKVSFRFIADLVRDLEHTFKRRLEASALKLSIKSSEPEYELHGDLAKLKKAIEALITNAILYSPSEATITLEIEKNLDSLTVAVEDEGIGIPAEHREQIFGKFFRGDEARRISPDGLGLGLFIARSFIEAHGGALKLEPKQSSTHGARFLATIPLGESRPLESAPAGALSLDSR